MGLDAASEVTSLRHCRLINIHTSQAFVIVAQMLCSSCNEVSLFAAGWHMNKLLLLLTSLRSLDHVYQALFFSHAPLCGILPVSGEIFTAACARKSSRELVCEVGFNEYLLRFALFVSFVFLCSAVFCLLVPVMLTLMGSLGSC